MKVDSSTRNDARTLQDGLARSQADSTGVSAAGTDTAATSGAASSTTAAAQGGANVSLSSLSSTMRSLAASGSADIDTAHVQSIKDAIRNGTLQIDSGKIADGVIQTARDLMKPTSSH
ncbi:flagellar biosynthesis anti-sigma factor FlgM [Paraburkholderia guartelaensis]|uniref:Negative regulator of flagellin synthesis n=1 Tax=Paraburkholderia guartelaensis TaxID=2546446 RepID=A0A4R5LED7_9BURK|nr:flagellar biosynthesis anti-sigma factor FlgM [Paraburkholderia guartelaensis]TDG07923.1 flagellar biosynthesis anti-sigma factor FlgM [Paraburkholderia guartelaensis]